MAKSQYLECAVIRSTHGVRGNVRMENLCNSTTDLCKLKRVYIKNGEEYREYKMDGAFAQKSMVVAHLEGIESVDDAAALRNVTLYASREDFKLKKDEFFIADMIGLPVYDNDTNEVIGELSDVIKPGAQQIYVIKKGDGEFMVPAVDEFVKKVSIDGTETDGIYIHLIEGFFD